MALVLQVKRGTLANRPTLAAGELYFATDTGVLYIGTASTPVSAVPATRLVNGHALSADVVVSASDLTTGAIAAARIPNGITNANSSQQSQVTVAGTFYYVAGSLIALPASPVNGIVVGTVMKWRVVLNKTAAGTGTFLVSIHMGTAGTVSDTKVVSQSIGTQTAAVDSVVIDIMVVFTAVGAGSASFYWTICPFQKAATATGFGVVTGVSGLFSGTVGSLNSTTANLKFGISFSSTTGTPTITVPYAEAEALNLV